MDTRATELFDLKGRTVYDAEGEKIGKVEDFYCGDGGTPEWVGIGTGIFGTKHVVVPIDGYTTRGDGISVPYPKSLVKDGPDVDEDELTDEREAELYEHYGLRQAGYRAATPMIGSDHRESDDSLVRREQEMRVGKRGVEAGRVRLRKWVETKPVSEDVVLREERLRVEREPIDEPAGNSALGEGEVEMVLTREEPVVEKRTVAKERVTLYKDVEERTEHVSGEVAEEHVEVEGDDADMREGHS
ncbi:MAG: PRC and DUF2382 domain-containing protein [Dehalococcoidia bacterium]|nr:PRC and DUF2382 domain-containing protein [Dehalococcoidia bacterium]